MHAMILAAAVATAPAPQPVDVACVRAGPTHAQQRGLAPDGPRKLGEMPPARAYRTVLRSIGGCPLVEVNVGGDWRLQPDGSARLVPLPAKRAK